MRGCNWLKASRMKGSHDESEWRNRQKVFDNDREGRDANLKLFQNRAGLCVVEKFLGFIARSRKGAGEVEGSTVSVDRLMHE